MNLNYGVGSDERGTVGRRSWSNERWRRSLTCARVLSDSTPLHALASAAAIELVLLRDLCLPLAALVVASRWGRACHYTVV